MPFSERAAIDDSPEIYIDNLDIRGIFSKIQVLLKIRGRYEYENFRNFFEFAILKLVEPQIFRPYEHSFHIFL